MQSKSSIKIYFDILKLPSPEEFVEQEFEGRYLLNRKPFTGNALKFTDSAEVEAVLELADGKIIGPTTDLFGDKNSQRISDRVLQRNEAYFALDIERYLFNGEDFEGFSYVFNDHGYLIEEYIIDPVKRIYRQWHVNGQLKRDHRNVHKQMTWHRKGGLKSHRHFTNDELSYSAKFNKAGALYYLLLAKKDTPHEKQHLEYPIGQRLTLYGRGIDDPLLQSCLSTRQLDSLTELVLVQTDVSAAAFNNMNLAKLSKLTLNFNNSLPLEWAQGIKKVHAQCTLVYDHKMIEFVQKLRVRMSALQQRQNKLYFGEDIFSGLAYSVDEQNILQRVLEVTDGTMADPSQDILLPNKTYPRVDSNRLIAIEPFVKGVCERYQLDGDEFIGIAYRFDPQGVLIEESFFDPEKQSSREWYATGQLKIEQTTQEYSAWYQNGQQMHHDANTIIEKYHADGSLYWLKVAEDIDRDTYPFRAYTLAKQVYIRGRGVTDLVLQEIFQTKYQSQVKQLYIQYTRASKNAIDEVKMACPQATVSVD